MQPESVLLSSAEVPAFVARVLQRCLDVHAVWSIGHGEEKPAGPRHQLLAFADTPTLQMLRKSDSLHRDDVEFLVVVDGDRFENAWGNGRLSGSLARWAWRPVSADVAYYDESQWAQHGNAGSVVRVRRKAILVWRRQ